MLRITAGAAGMIIFMLPVFSGVINIGNIPALIFFTLIFIWGIKRKTADPKLRELYKRKGYKIFMNIIIAVFAAGIIFISAESILMAKAARNLPEENTTLVVLGCKVNGSSPSQMLEGRIEAAGKYMKENPGIKAVLSGGKGDDEDISEAQCMYNCLTASGIDPGRLFIEDRSTSTEENIKFSYEIIKKEGLNNKITIVSNEFHLYRAGLTAKKLRLENYSLPAKTPPVFMLTYIIREYFAIAARWLT